MVSQRELAFKAAVGDAAVQVGLATLIFLFGSSAADRQHVLLYRDVQLRLLETGNSHGNFIIVLRQLGDVVRRVTGAALIELDSAVYQLRQMVETNGGTE